MFDLSAGSTIPLAPGEDNHCITVTTLGEATVPVANCKQEQYSSHPKEDWILADFLKYWQTYKDKGYPADQACLYLKDWHFTKAFPEYQAYETPEYFQSDWLNEFWDTLQEDDYRFVYMGPKGTWTPFHSDVYRSFSWSANICGRKKWIFYPPGCEVCLMDRFGHLVYDVESPDLSDPIKYPRATEVKDKVIEVIQEQGQVIFVPSGWHHQVYNLEDTISINHNWLNGCNIDICWKHLMDSLADVKTEIGDCRDMEGWHEQCQLILKASAGLDFKMFIDLLETIAINRNQTWTQGNYSTTDRLTYENLESSWHSDGDREAIHIGTVIENEAKDSRVSIIEDKMRGKSIIQKHFAGPNNANTIFEESEKNDETIIRGAGFGKEYEGFTKENSTSIEEELSDNVKFCKIVHPAEFTKSHSESKGINQLESKEISVQKWTLSSQEFCLFDIIQIKQVLQSIMGNNDLQQLPSEYFVRVKNIYDHICKTVGTSEM